MIQKQEDAITKLDIVNACNVRNAYNVLNACNVLINRGYSDFNVFFSKGKALKELMRYKNAIACFEKALQKKPSNFSALYEKGVCLYNTEKYDQALEVFLSLPDNYEVKAEDTHDQTLLKVTYSESQEQEIDYSAYFQHQEDLNSMMGYCFLNKKEFEKANQCFKKCKPNNYVFLLQSICSFSLNDNKKAIEYMRKCQETTDIRQNQIINKFLLKVISNDDLTKEDKQNFQQLKKCEKFFKNNGHKTDYINTVYKEGIYYLNNNNYYKAIKKFKKVIKQADTTNESLQMESWKKAIKDIINIETSNHDNQENYETTIALLRDTRDSRDGKFIFDLLYEKALWYNRTGDYLKAVKCCTMAILNMDKEHPYYKKFFELNKESLEKNYKETKSKDNKNKIF